MFQRSEAAMHLKTYGVGPTLTLTTNDKLCSRARVLQEPVDAARALVNRDERGRGDDGGAGAGSSVMIDRHQELRKFGSAMNSPHGLKL